MRPTSPTTGTLTHSQMCSDARRVRKPKARVQSGKRSGNNLYGAKGKPKCAACRTAHRGVITALQPYFSEAKYWSVQCEFDSLDERCKNCIRKGLPCDKKTRRGGAQETVRISVLEQLCTDFPNQTLGSVLEYLSGQEDSLVPQGASRDSSPKSESSEEDSCLDKTKSFVQQIDCLAKSDDALLMEGVTPGTQSQITVCPNIYFQMWLKPSNAKNQNVYQSMSCTNIPHPMSICAPSVCPTASNGHLWPLIIWIYQYWKSTRLIMSHIPQSLSMAYRLSFKFHLRITIFRQLVLKFWFSEGNMYLSIGGIGLTSALLSMENLYWYITRCGFCPGGFPSNWKISSIII